MKLLAPAAVLTLATSAPSTPPVGQVDLEACSGATGRWTSQREAGSGKHPMNHVTSVMQLKLPFIPRLTVQHLDVGYKYRGSCELSDDYVAIW